MKAAKIWFSITTATALILVVVGFIIPPMGVIDGSVLTAVGELMGFAALAQVPPLIKKGADVVVALVIVESHHIVFAGHHNAGSSS